MHPNVPKSTYFLKTSRAWHRLFGCIYILTTICYNAECVNNTVYHQLRTNLLVNYDPDLRPVNDTSETVAVGFRINPTISILAWSDPRLAWELEEYGNLSKIDLPIERNGERKIWVPELVLNESIETDFESFHADTKIVTLYHTGEVYWYTLVITRSFCGIAVRYYPFDKQTCHLTFTTWVYNKDQQFFYHIDDLISNKTGKQYELNQHKWVTNIVVSVGSAEYDCVTCENETHSYVHYRLELRRYNRLLYFSHLILPCAVVSLMMFLVVLFHQTDSATFGLTCILTLFVYLTYLFTSIPSTGVCIVSGYIIWLILEGIITTLYALLKTQVKEARDSGSSESSPEGKPEGGTVEEEGKDNDAFFEVEGNTTTESSPDDKGVDVPKVSPNVKSKDAPKMTASTEETKTSLNNCACTKWVHEKWHKYIMEHLDEVKYGILGVKLVTSIAWTIVFAATYSVHI